VRISSGFSALSHSALRFAAPGIAFAQLSIVRGPIGGRAKKSAALPTSVEVSSLPSLVNPRIHARAECVHGEAKGRGLVVCVPVRTGEHLRMHANSLSVSRKALALVWVHASIWTAVLAVTCSLPLAVHRRLSIHKWHSQRRLAHAVRWHLSSR
jgi:hypothetical protein